MMKRTIVGLTLFLLGTSVWAGTLIDDFDDGNLLGWRVHDKKAQWFVKNGELVSTSRDNCGNHTVLAIGDTTWKDYEFSVQFKLEQTYHAACHENFHGWVAIGFGGHFTSRNAMNAFVTELNGNIDVWNEFGCAYLSQRKFRTYRIGRFITRQGKWHTAKFIADGEEYKMFIDNRLICRRRDAFGLLGKGGVYLFTRNCEVHFDNVVITGDNIPDQNLSVFPKDKLTATWGQIKSF